MRIPIELKSIWQDTEIREIKKIIQDDYIAEIAHHARNTVLGILVIVEIRNSVKALNLKDNNFIMFDKESKYPIFVCVFQKYGQPSSA
ncbi:MAG: hypothetical protein JSW06_07340 [Thermoplasmatales archaeon]|nr:MAG: hypothetical protein JSW06_07340 [Thermoplasmatales archaeon]